MSSIYWVALGCLALSGFCASAGIVQLVPIFEDHAIWFVASGIFFGESIMCIILGRKEARRERKRMAEEVMERLK